MHIESKRDYSISLIRMIATAFILACHIMQCLSMELAWWFNVGVQMFLVMSGFLYGKKGRIENSLKFYKKNLLKILIDYYVVIIPVLLLYAVFLPEKLSAVLLIKVLLTCGTITGGEHLWYIPYCILCYLITPFLSRYFDKCKNNHIVLHFLLLSVSVFAVTESFLRTYYTAGIVCYILGFFLGSISAADKRKLYNHTSVIIILVAILLNSIQIVQDYVLKFELSGIINMLYPRFCNYAHVALGAALFVALKYVFSGVFQKGYPYPVKKLCSFSDKYSYDIYLVHWFVIIVFFLLKQALEIDIAGIIGIVTVTIASAALVNLISNYIRSKIKDFSL